VAYRFIDKHQKEFGLRWLLVRTGICPNGYYNYLKRARADYQHQKTVVCQSIKSIYHELSGIVGYRSMKVFLARKGIFLSKPTVHKYMNKELHLQCVCRRKRPDYKKSHAHAVFPNLIQQKFLEEKPNQVWCTDFTYLYITNGTIHDNCTMIDLYDRSVVPSVNDRWMTSDIAIAAVKKAIQATGCNPKGLILHSDQGSQFTSLEFILFCRDFGIQHESYRMPL
jgi:putative transposase